MARLGRANSNGSGSVGDSASTSRFSSLVAIAAAETDSEAPEIIEEPSEPNPMPTAAQATKPKKKVAKSKSPDHKQVSIHLARVVDAGIDQVVTELELADQGLGLDRSDVINEVMISFLALSKKLGAVQALNKFKNLST